MRATKALILDKRENLMKIEQIEIRIKIMCRSDDIFVGWKSFVHCVMNYIFEMIVQKLIMNEWFFVIVLHIS